MGFKGGKKMELYEVVPGEYETPDGENQLRMDLRNGNITGFFEDENERIFNFKIINNQIKWEIRPQEFEYIEEKIFEYKEYVEG
jgi:hypothetical protein